MQTISNKKIMLCLFALSTLQMGALAVASSIAEINVSFPNVSTTLVQMLITLPILVQTPIAIFSSWFCRHFSARTLLLAVVILFLIGGLLPFAVHVFPLIMFSRCLYGAAIGLQIPIVSTLTIEFFNGSERAKIMGYCSAIGMLGGMFYTYAGGFLASFGWQFSFLAYLIGIPVLFCIIFLFPKGVKTGANPRKSTYVISPLKISPELFFIAGVSMIYIIFYFAYTNNISLFVNNEALGASAESGISYSIVNGSGFLGGLIFGNLIKKFKHNMFWISAAVTAIGFITISYSYKLIPLYIGSIFLGIGLSWFLPQCNLRIAEIVSPDSLSFAYGLNSAISNLGQFLSVLVIGTFANLLNLSNIRGIFLLAFWGNIAVVIIFFIYTKFWCTRHP